MTRTWLFTLLNTSIWIVSHTRKRTMDILNQLRLLSPEDQRQRYADSYINYKGTTNYVQNILENGAYLLKNPVLGDYIEDPFDWNQLNTERPKSGWYIYKDGNNHNVCQYFRLMTKKQYHRGLTEANCFVMTPIPNRQGKVDKYKLFDLAQMGPDPRKVVVSWEDLWQRLVLGGPFIQLQPYMIALITYETIKLLYRTQEILSFNTNEKKFWCPDTVTFKDEINESIINFPWEQCKKDKGKKGLKYPVDDVVVEEELNKFIPKVGKWKVPPEPIDNGWYEVPVEEPQ